MSEDCSLELSVVIPVFNSADILPTLVPEVVRYAGSCAKRFEVILVNDFSLDSSWNAISSLATHYPQVRGLNLRRNTGQHNAIMAGLNLASGAVIVLMDDDMQHSPSDIPKLFRKISEGHDVCYAKFRRTKHALWKRIGSAFNNWISGVLLGKPNEVRFTSFKSISLEVCREIIKYDGPYAYIDGLILMTTSYITSIDVEHSHRLAGKGNYNFRKSVLLWMKMATSFSIIPLQLAGLVGALLALLGFVFAGFALVLRLTGTVAVPLGWTSLLISMSIIGGFQLIALWLIGEYLGRAYVKLNRVPQYSIREFRNVIGQKDGNTKH